MNDLALEQRINRFQETFLKDEKPQLSPEGLIQLGSLLYDSNYRLYQENVYVRTHDNQSVDLFVQEDLKTGSAGFSYMQISGVREIQPFLGEAHCRQRPLPVYDGSGDVAGGIFLGGLTGLAFTGLISLIIANPLPLLATAPVMGGGAYLGRVMSKGEYEENLKRKKQSDAVFDAKYTLITGPDAILNDAVFDAKYHLITGKDAILKALIPEYHPE